MLPLSGGEQLLQCFGGNTEPCSFFFFASPPSPFTERTNSAAGGGGILPPRHRWHSESPCREPSLVHPGPPLSHGVPCLLVSASSDPKLRPRPPPNKEEQGWNKDIDRQKWLLLFIIQMTHNSSANRVSNDACPPNTSTLLPTCPLSVYGYAASTTQMDRHQRALVGFMIRCRHSDCKDISRDTGWGGGEEERSGWTGPQVDEGRWKTAASYHRPDKY